MADPRDFEELFVYYNAVAGYFRRVGFSADEARDLSQDTFVRVYEHMKQYRGDARWEYIKKVARTVASNELRRRSTHKRDGDEVSVDETHAFVDPSDSPDTLLIRKERRARLYEAVNALPQRLRTCTLLYLAEFQYSEMQQILGCTLDAVKSCLYEARKRLKAMLAEDVLQID